MPGPVIMVIGLGQLLTFLAAASPLATRSRPKQSNGRRSNGGTDEISISACDSDHPGGGLRYVGRGLCLQRAHHDQPQRAYRARRGIRQGRDAAGGLQGKCHRLPAWLVQDTWWRCQRLGQFGLSCARPSRASACHHRAPAASAAALAPSAPSPSPASSPAAQAASGQVQDRARFPLQIEPTASGTAHGMPLMDRGRWPRSAFLAVSLMGQGPPWCQERGR